MTESMLHTLITRMALDADFARSVQSEPDAVAEEYGLSENDIAMLTSMTVDTSTRRLPRLEERLSRSGLFFGSELHTGGHDSGHSGDSGGHSTSNSSNSSHSSSSGGDSGHSNTSSHANGSTHSSSSSSDSGHSSSSGHSTSSNGSGGDAAHANGSHANSSQSNGSGQANSSAGHATSSAPANGAGEHGSAQSASGSAPTTPAASTPAAPATTASAPADTAHGPGQPAGADGAHPAPGQAAPGQATPGPATTTGSASDGSPTTATSMATPGSSATPDAAATASPSAAHSGSAPTTGDTTHADAGSSGNAGSTSSSSSAGAEGTAPPGSAGSAAGGHATTSGSDGAGAGTSAAPGPVTSTSDVAPVTSVPTVPGGTGALAPSASGAAVASSATLAGGQHGTGTANAPTQAATTSPPDARAVGGGAATFQSLTVPTETTGLAADQNIEFTDNGTAGADATAAANSSYHGGIVDQQDLGHRADDNTNDVRLTFGDGSTADGQHYYDRAGNSHTEYTRADGTTVDDVQGRTSGSTTIGAPDGTTTSTSWSDSNLTQEVTTPDGSTSQTEWSAPRTGTSGEEMFHVTDQDGTYTSVVATPGGGALAATLPPGGGAAQTVRLDVAQIDNPDGSTTRVFTYPDGHTDAFTFDTAGNPVAHEAHPATDPGAGPVPQDTTPATADYHGGIVAQQDLATNPDGTTTVQVTYGDGSTQQVTRTLDADGYPTDAYDQPDGTHVSDATHADYSSHVLAHPDDTSTITTWSGTTLSESSYGADGAETTATEWSSPLAATPGQELFHITEANGPYTSVVATPGGGALAATLPPGGGAAQTVRLDVAQIDNPDGSTTRVFTYPDGHTDAFTFDTAGNPVAHEAHPATDPGAGPVPQDTTPATADYHGGIVAQQDLATNPDGTTTVQVTYGDGSTQQVTRTLDADGYPTDAYDQPDGTHVSDATHADYSSHVLAHPDDTSTITTWSGTTLSESSYGADGAETTATEWSSPLAATPGQELFHITEANGPYTSVVATPGGGALAATLPPGGGAAQTVRLDVAQIDNPDGSTTRVFTYPDGHTDAFTFDTAGNPVAHEAHPATDPGAGPVPQDTTPATADYHGGIVAQQDLATNPDGTTTVQVTYGDGTTVEAERGVSTDNLPVLFHTRADGADVADFTTADGGVTRITVPGGPTTRTEWTDSSLLERVTDTDDRVTSTMWSSPMEGTPGQELFHVSGHEGDFDTFTSVVAAPGGGATAMLSQPNGAVEHVRLDVGEIDNPDGSTTRVFTYPDGHTDAFTFDSSGRAVAHEAHLPPLPAPEPPVMAPLGTTAGEDAPTTAAAGTSGVDPTTSSPAPGESGTTRTAATEAGTTQSTGTQSTGAGATDTTGATPATDTDTDTDTDTQTTGPQTTGTPSTDHPASSTSTEPSTSGAGQHATDPGPVHTASTAGPVLAPAAAVTASAGPIGAYHGGDVATKVLTTNTDGSKVLLVTRADGTSVQVHRVVDASGQNVDSYENTDGSEVVTTVGTGAAAETGHTTIVGTDGSSIVRTWDGAGLHEADTDAAGVTREFGWSSTMQGTPGQELFSIKTTGAESAAVTTTINATADGGAVATATDAAGDSATARLTVTEIPNSDGSHTRVFGFPDGHSEAFTFDAAGTPVAHQTIAPAPQPATHAADARATSLGTDTQGTNDQNANPVAAADGRPTHPGQASHPGEPGRHQHEDGQLGHWAQDLRGAVLDAMNGRTVPGGDAYHSMINGVAQFVSTALKSGPEGLPNAPWADDVAQFLVGALHLGQGDQHADPEPATDGSGVPHSTAEGATAGTTHTASTDAAAAGTTHPASTDAATTQAIAAGQATAATAGVPPTVVSSATDGSRVETTATADGSTAQVTYHADGSVETLAKSATTGRTTDTVVAADGTLSRTVTTADGSTGSLTQHADGAKTTAVQTADGSLSAETVHDDGTWSATRHDAASGQTIQKSLDGEGTVSYTDTRSDGSVITAEKHADGSVIQQVKDAQGNTVDTTRAADGTGSETTRTADGHVEVKSLAKDGTQSESVTNPDGSFTSVTLGPDGTKTIANGTADGSSVTQATATDGTVTTTAVDGETEHHVVTTQAHDGSVTQRDTAPDGSYSQVVQAADKSTADVTVVDGNGATIKTVHIQDPGTDHSVSTEHDISDGQTTHTVVTTKSPDGSATLVDTAADGTITTQQVSADQATVNATMTAADGTVIRTVHVADANTDHSVTTVTNADTSTVVTTDGPGGSSTELATAADQSWTRTVTTPVADGAIGPTTVHITTSDNRTIDGAVNGDGSSQWSEQDASTDNHSIVTTNNADKSVDRMDRAPDGTWTSTHTSADKASATVTTSDGRTISIKDPGTDHSVSTEKDDFTGQHTVITSNTPGTITRLDIADDGSSTTTVITPSKGYGDVSATTVTTIYPHQDPDVDARNAIYGATGVGQWDPSNTARTIHTTVYTDGRTVSTETDSLTGGNTLEIHAAGENSWTRTTTAPNGEVIGTADSSGQHFVRLHQPDGTTVSQTTYSDYSTVTLWQHQNGDYEDQTVSGNGTDTQIVRYVAATGKITTENHHSDIGTVRQGLSTDPADTSAVQAGQAAATAAAATVPTVVTDSTIPTVPSTTASMVSPAGSTYDTTITVPGSQTGQANAATTPATASTATAPAAATASATATAPATAIGVGHSTVNGSTPVPATAGQSSFAAAPATGSTPGSSGGDPTSTGGAPTTLRTESLAAPPTSGAETTGGPAPTELANTGLPSGTASSATPAGLVAAGTGAATNLATTGETAATGALADAGKQVTSGLTDAGKQVTSGLTDAGKQVTSGLTDAGKQVTSGLTDAGKQVTSGLADARNTITGAVADPVGTATKVLGDPGNVLAEGQQVLSDPSGALTKGVGSLEKTGGDLLQKGTDTLTDGLNGLEKTGTGLLDKGTGMVNGALGKAGDVEKQVAGGLSDPGALLDRGLDKGSDALDSLMTGDNLDKLAGGGLNLPGGAVGKHTYTASFDESFGLAGSLEGSTTIDGVLFEGGMSVEVGGGISAMATATLGPSGITAMAEGKVWIGADAEIHGAIVSGDTSLRGAAEGMAGADAEGLAVAKIGLSGIFLTAGGEAFAGAEADANANADFGFGQGTFGAGVSAGIGANFEAGADLSLSKIGFHIDAGATLGVGLNIDVDASMDTSRVGMDALTGMWQVDLASDGVKLVGGVAHAVGEGSEKLGGAIESGLDDLGDDARNGSFVGDTAAIALHNVGEITGESIKVGGAVLSVIGDGVSEIGKGIGTIADVAEDVVDEAGKILPWNW